jgi:hypothetical protein
VTHTRELPDTCLGSATMDAALVECIVVCSECAKSCSVCAEACFGQEVEHMRRCFTIFLK